MEAATGIVLAGGRSRRLGEDKALLRLAGKTLLERAVSPLLPLCSRVVVVTSTERPTPRTLDWPQVEAVADAVPNRGPLGGLYTGLLAAHTEWCLVVACDMPLLNPEVLRLLLGLAEGWQAVVPRVGGIPQPLHAVYSRDCLPAVGRLLAMESQGPTDLLRLVKVRYVAEETVSPLDPQLLSFFSVNTEADLARARELLE